jgi:ribonuclease HIII
MEKENKHNFPRGASQTVIQEAADFIRKSGNLSEVAKISFKTTEKVNELIKNSN